jgi:hypothetical protein
VDNGVSWSNANSTPTSTDGAVTIRNGHVVTIDAAGLTFDQVTIESGGTLTLSAAATIANGTGDDVVIQNGGTFTLGAAPTFGTSATANVNTGGTVKVATTGLTANGAGVNATNFVYQDASILEYTLTSNFSGSGVTYFPGVSASTIPIFRVSSIVLSPGGASNTVINGVFEVTSGNSVTWSGAGTKTFRNGIRGAGTVTQSTAGQFIINGATAYLGGAGTLTLGTNGLLINAASVTTLSSNKVVNSGTITVGGTSAGTLDCGTFQISGTGGVTVASTGTLKVGSLNASGAIADNITTTSFTLSTGSTVEYNGLGAQFATARTFTNLTLNNSAGLTLLGDVTVNGALTFTSGNITTGANKIAIASVGSVARTSGYVVGNLQKTYAGTGLQTFEVGTANGYSPASVNATSVTAGSTLTVSATQGIPTYAPSQTNSLSRYWTFTGTGITAANVSFTYLAGDVTGTLANYKFFRNVSGTITAFDPTSITTTSATLNGVTSLAGDWTLGEKGGQTITFGALASKTYGDSSFGLTGTASSGLGVTYASSNTNVATLSGSTVTIVGAGSTTITASQAGNTLYYAATNVPQTLTVNPATLESEAVIFTPSGGGYTASSGTATSFAITYAGRNGTTYASSATVPTRAGFYTVTATSTDPNYSGSNTHDYFVAGPLAAADAFTRPPSSAGIRIPVASLLANDSRVTSGGAIATNNLSVTAVTAGTGNSVSLSGGFVLYTPSVLTNNGPLTFTYTLSDGSTTDTATVTVSSGAATAFTLSMLRVVTPAAFASGNTTVTVEFAGVPNQTYNIEYTYRNTVGSELLPWIPWAGIPTGSTGTFNVTFTATGNLVSQWGSLFFRATR